MTVAHATLARLGLAVLLAATMITAVAVATGRPALPLHALAAVRSAGGSATPRANDPIAALPVSPVNGPDAARSPAGPTPDLPTRALTADAREVGATITRSEQAEQTTRAARATDRRAAAQRAARRAAQAAVERRSTARRTSTAAANRAAAQAARKKAATRTATRRTAQDDSDEPRRDGPSTAKSHSTTKTASKAGSTPKSGSASAAGSKPDSGARSDSGSFQRSRAGLLRSGATKIKKIVSRVLHR